MAPGPMCSRDKGAWKEGELYMWGLKKRFSDVMFLISSTLTRWWFQIFFFHPYLGKIPNLTNIFSNGLVQPPPS